MRRLSFTALATLIVLAASTLAVPAAQAREQHASGHRHAHHHHHHRHHGHRGQRGH